MERESLIGMWDVYAGPSHSELLLQPDGNFYHSMWGGAQSYWGSWSLNDQDGHTVIALKLVGAQPTIVMGPFGPQPVQWPPVEQWALTAVQPDQVRFFGGLMVRRALSAQPAAAQAGAMPAQLGVPQPPPAGQFVPPTPPSFSELAAYSAPPPPPPPEVHSADILTQWQGANLEMYKAQQAANLQASMAQRQAGVDAFAANQAMNVTEFSALQHATFQQSAAVHAGVQSFIETLK